MPDSRGAIADTSESWPVILPRSKHPISRKKIDHNALKVLYRLHNHGYKAYLVGGSVRDMLLGKVPKDFDIATDARPNQIKKLFGNCRLVGRRFRLAHIIFRGRQIIEVSTFRKKSEWMPQKDDSPVVKSENTFGSPAQDASRRDLTINGMFYNIADFSIIDYVGGLRDLEMGIIRIIGNAKERLYEDPVRMLRAIRHAARTDFEIDPEAMRVIREKGALIRDCAAPRIREEFMRELRGGWAVPSFKIQLQCGLLGNIFPFYGDALSGLFGENIRDHLMSNLAGADKIINRGYIISDAELIAAFICPIVHLLEIFKDLPRGRKGASTVHRRIRERLKPVIREAGFSKGYAESACYMIFAQYLLKQAIDQGQLPGYLLSKTYFGPGLRLFQIEATGRDRPMPDMFLKAARKRKIELLDQNFPEKKRRRKKAGRKRKSQSNKPN